MEIISKAESPSFGGASQDGKKGSVILSTRSVVLVSHRHHREATGEDGFADRKECEEFQQALISGNLEASISVSSFRSQQGEGAFQGYCGVFRYETSDHRVMAARVFLSSDGRLRSVGLYDSQELPADAEPNADHSGSENCAPEFQTTQFLKSLTKYFNLALFVNAVSYP